MDRKVFGSKLEDGRWRDSDAQWYRYLKILAQQPSPISILDFKKHIGHCRSMVHLTLLRLYNRQLCDRVLVQTCIKEVKRHEYTITDGGRRWVAHYEMMEDKYGS